jgi:hypothetical protein
MTPPRVSEEVVVPRRGEVIVETETDVTPAAEVDRRGVFVRAHLHRHADATCQRPPWAVPLQPSRLVSTPDGRGDLPPADQPTGRTPGSYRGVRARVRSGARPVITVNDRNCAHDWHDLQMLDVVMRLAEVRLCPGEHEEACHAARRDSSRAGPWTSGDPWKQSPGLLGRRPFVPAPTSPVRAADRRHGRRPWRSSSSRA